MNKPTNKYWQKRFTLLTESLLNKSENYYKELEEEYEKFLSILQRDIEHFYIRFSDNNEITMTDARRILDNRELKEFHWTVEEYIKKCKENSVDQRWIKELENASTRVRLSRLQSLQYQIRQQVEIIAAKRLIGLTKLSEELIKEGYYRSIYEAQKGFRIGDTFTILDSRTIESIIAKPWAPDGSNFSERIWRDRELLVSELQKELAQSFIRGDAPDTVIRSISKKMDVSKRAAGRLIMTESAFFANEARAKAFKELGVEEYQFLATLDMRTSDICQKMDLEIFKLSERILGVNWPPLHCWCRSTVVPHFEGNIKQRWARDIETGKGYYVPGDMNYKEWYKEHVEGKYSKALAK
jgi:SPP1 gp7 family putative phage head morphogenesis protein